jgi:hypothetical protein
VHQVEFGSTEDVKFRAAREILDRAYGKPMQATESTHKGALTISWIGEASAASGDEGADE